MIANERQYSITSTALREFEEALANLDIVEAHRPAEMRRLMREAIESQIEELRGQITEYELAARRQTAADSRS